MASLVFFRLLVAIGVGGLFALAVLNPRQAALGFFRFSAGLYVALAVIGATLAPGLTVAERGAFAAGLVCGGAYVALAPRLERRAGRALVGAAALLGAVGLGLFVASFASQAAAGAAPSWTRLGAWLPLAAEVASIVLLGSVLTAMVLGHWYLVMPGAPVEPLLRLSRLYLLSLLARAALLAAGAAAVEGRLLARALDDVGLLVWPRLLFGLAAPLVLAFMVLPTVKIRSTQAATGMLYIACVLVLVGEGLAKYLEIRTRLAV
jgi:hypothetical protein